MTVAVACTDGDGGEARELPPSDCRIEVSDGCLTVRAGGFGPGRFHFHLATSTGEPVRQYGVAHTLHFYPRSKFTRPVRPGGYILQVYRGPPPSGGVAPSTAGDCSRTFGVRTTLHRVFKIEWDRGKERCKIVRAPS